MIGKTADAGENKDKQPAGAGGEGDGAVEFSELLGTLSTIKVTPDQLINAIEHLHKTGALHAQLQYE